MTFILRWPVIIALLALSLITLASSGLTLAAHYNVSLASLPLSPEQLDILNNTSTMEAWLWLGAGVCFLISMVRLIRRTQGFWFWLFGFAFYGARWGLGLQGQGGLEANLRTLNADSFQPNALMASTTTPATQAASLAVVLVIGLLIFVIDAADRHYWNKHEHAH